MSYVITTDCIKCGVCKDACMEAAIIEGDMHFIITDDCIECGACLHICPLGAIEGLEHLSEQSG